MRYGRPCLTFPGTAEVNAIPSDSAFPDRGWDLGGDSNTRRKKGRGTKGNNRRLRSSPSPIAGHPVVRSVLVANVGDVTVKFDRVYLSAAGVRTFTHRSGTGQTQSPGPTQAGGGDRGGCSFGGFRLLGCRDRDGRGAADYNVANTTQDGDLPIFNLGDGFSLPPRSARTIRVAHSPDCTFRNGFAAVVLEYAWRPSEAPRSGHGSGSFPPRTDSPFRPAAAEFLVGFEMTEQQSLNCVPAYEHRRGLLGLVGMLQSPASTIRAAFAWPLPKEVRDGGKIKLTDVCSNDGNGGYGDTTGSCGGCRCEGDENEDDGGARSASSILPHLPAALALYAALLLLSDASEVAWNVARRHMSCVGFRGRSLAPQICPPPDVVERSDSVGERGASEGGSRQHHTPCLPPPPQTSPPPLWASSYRLISRCDPGSSDLINLGREQTRQTVLGRYRRMGGCGVVGCLSPVGEFAREQHKTASGVASSSGEKGEADKDGVAESGGASLARKVRRRVSSTGSTGSRGVVTLSDALFGRAEAAAESVRAEAVSSSLNSSGEDGALPLLLPLGLGWREAAARGIPSPHEVGEGLVQSVLLTDRVGELERKRARIADLRRDEERRRQRELSEIRRRRKIAEEQSQAVVRERARVEAEALAQAQAKARVMAQAEARARIRQKSEAEAREAAIVAAEAQAMAAVMRATAAQARAHALAQTRDQTASSRGKSNGVLGRAVGPIDPVSSSFDSAASALAKAVGKKKSPTMAEKTSIDTSKHITNPNMKAAAMRTDDNRSVSSRERAKERGGSRKTQQQQNQRAAPQAQAKEEEVASATVSVQQHTLRQHAQGHQRDSLEEKDQKQQSDKVSGKSSRASRRKKAAKEKAAKEAVEVEKVEKVEKADMERRRKQQQKQQAQQQADGEKSGSGSRKGGTAVISATGGGKVRQQQSTANLTVKASTTAATTSPPNVQAGGVVWGLKQTQPLLGEDTTASNFSGNTAWRQQQQAEMERAAAEAMQQPSVPLPPPLPSVSPQVSLSSVTSCRSIGGGAGGGRNGGVQSQHGQQQRARDTSWELSALSEFLGTAAAAASSGGLPPLTPPGSPAAFSKQPLSLSLNPANASHVGGVGLQHRSTATTTVPTHSQSQSMSSPPLSTESSSKSGVALGKGLLRMTGSPSLSPSQSPMGSVNPKALPVRLPPGLAPPPGFSSTAQHEKKQQLMTTVESSSIDGIVPPPLCR